MVTLAVEIAVDVNGIVRLAVEIALTLHVCYDIGGQYGSTFFGLAVCD